MKLHTQTVQVFDPPMCCATGVCGPGMDPKLAQFAADLDWLKRAGVITQRYNLAQNPAAYVENQLVQTTLTEKGEAALPLVLINGQIAMSGRYPERKELAERLNLKATEPHTAAKSSCGCGGNC